VEQESTEKAATVAANKILIYFFICVSVIF